MPDQVGSTAVSIDLLSSKLIPPQITYPPFVGSTRYALSQGIIIEPYMYVMVRKSGIATTSQLHKIFRINLDFPDRGWEYLANSDYNRYQSNESTAYHGSSVGIIGNKFAYYSTHSWLNSGGGTSYISAIYDLDLMTGYNQSSIRGVCTAVTYAYQTNVGWFFDCPENNKTFLHLATGDDGSSSTSWYLFKSMLWLPRNNLTASYQQTAEAPYWWSRKAPINWNGDIYLIGGLRSDSLANSGSNTSCGWGTLYYYVGTTVYSTTGSLKYSPSTNTWTDNPIPAIPNYQYDGSTTVLARNNVIYTLRPSVNLRHFYDLRWGDSGTWQTFPLPDVTGDHNCSLTYDSARNCLWYINYNGILQRLDLTEDGYPKSGNWENYINYALLGTIQIGVVPDATFDTTLSSLDCFQTATVVDVPFVIESAGARITAHPQVGSINTTFTFTSSIAAALGAIQTGVLDVPFVIESSGTYDSVVASDIPFVIGSSASGSVVVNAIQTGTADCEFFIETDAVVFNNIIGNATSTIEISSTGVLLIGIVGLSANATFRIETEARLLTNVVGTGAANIIVSATGQGITGNVGVGAADFVIESLAFTYTSIIERNAINNSFVIVANGSAYVGINGEEINVPFVINSDGVLSVGLINNTTPNVDIVIEAEAIGAANAVAQGLATFIIDQLNAYGQLYSAGGDLVKTTDEIDAWVVNGQSGGHAAFTSYQFNGFFKIGNTYYATSEEGLYRLDVNDDNGAQINGYVATPVSDFGDRRLKAVSDAYVNMRTDGSIEFRVVVDERTDRLGYRIDIAEGHGLKRRRKKLHKGVKGTNWQIEFKNANGSHTEVASIDIAPDILKRTV